MDDEFGGFGGVGEEGDEDVDFWAQMDAFQGDAAEAQGEEPAAPAADGAGAPVDDTAPEAGAAADAAPAAPDHGPPAIVSVPADRTQELMRKRERIEALAAGASLHLSGTLLRIRGAPRARRAAERCAITIASRSCALGDGGASASAAGAHSAAEDFGDLSVVPLVEDFAKDWEGSDLEKRLEEDFGVLAVLCDESGARRATANRGPGASIRKFKQLVGQVVEAKWGTGHSIAVAMRPLPSAPNSMRLMWAYDGSVSDAEPDTLRPLTQLAIFGAPDDRMKAVLHLLCKMEEGPAPGISWAYAFTSHSARSLGVEAPPEARVGWRTKDRLGWGLIDVFCKVTGCLSVSFTRMCLPDSSRRHIDQQAVLAGSQAARWYASNLLQFLSGAWDRMRFMPPAGKVPPPLAGECVAFTVPQDVMGAIMGYRQKTIRQIMEDHQCLIVPNRELKGEGKREATEDDDLLELMFDHVRHGSTQELVVFGSQRSRLVVRARIMSIVEGKYPGYHRRPEGPEPIVLDPSRGVGLDQLWLDADFETDASDERASLLAAAAGCAVFSGGQVVFLVGDPRQRRRAREYLPWVLAWLATKKSASRLPHITDAANRKDVLLLQSVPGLVWSSKWLRAEMMKLSKKHGVWAFFDDWLPNTMTSQHDDCRRMVVAGEAIERHGASSDMARALLEQAKALLVEAEEWEQDGGKMWYKRQQDKRDELRRQEEERKRKEEQQRQEEAAAAAAMDPDMEIMDESMPLPMPATPAFPAGMATPRSVGVGVALPATPMPAGFGGIAPPATPAPPGLGGVAPPATPAPLAPATPGANFGPHGHAVPCTPGMPGVRPPATPGVLPPSTPGGLVRPPATPVGFVRPPATPVGYVRPPATPGGHLPPPATPGGFGPHGGAVPSTPAVMRLPPPATPGGAPPPPATPGGLAAPCTPAVLTGAKRPTEPGIAEEPPRKRPAPQTPAGLEGPAARTPGAFGALATPPRAMPATPAGLGDGLATPAAPPGGATKVLTFATVAAQGGGRLLDYAAGAAPPSAARAAPRSVEPPLPPGWEKKISKSHGKAYYWNAKLVKSQYERPMA